MATNPNVPAGQKAAAEGSAPNAKVVPVQPVQQAAKPAQTEVKTGDVKTAQAAPAVAAPKAAPVDKNEGVDRKAQIADEQKTLDRLSDKAKDLGAVEQQELYAREFESRIGEDSFRRAARLERERLEAENAGDPTRDPVAKQKAMDMNTVQPGAVADAERIKEIGREARAEENDRLNILGKEDAEALDKKVEKQNVKNVGDKS